ncbi:hypothetical protein BH20ACT22_BH20ACT22_26470 [soil metagenome]
MITGKRKLQVAGLALVGLLAMLIALPAAGVPKDKGPVKPNPLFTRLSQSVGIRYWVAHPEAAPSDLQERFRRVGEVIEGVPPAAAQPTGQAGQRFNHDAIGFPQNEESVSVCTKRPDVVLSGTNDYRGLLDQAENFTGWHLSTDGGETVRNEGLLPPVRIGGAPTPSGGDPVDVVTRNCALYAASLNYDPADPSGAPNGVGVYKTDVQTLANCPGGSAPSCWPNRRAVAQTTPPNFYDKEWFDVGQSGPDGRVVWVAFSDFVIDPDAPLGFTSASIKAVRCDGALEECTEPILISGADEDVQFSDVTIGPDGRTYITWSEIRGELEQTPQTFVHKLRVAQPGSTTFGPARVIHRETKAIPFGGFMHANDFRVATYPKSEVTMVGDEPRVFAVWDACRYRLLDSTCEESIIKFTYSDSFGRSWSALKTVSRRRGDSYFPTISAGPHSRSLAVAYFTNRHDRVFHNRQDVELTTVGVNGKVQNRQRLTHPSNESEADPLFGGFFIGDYIETSLVRGKAYTAYNANYRSVRVLGEGFPVPQQDNYLKRSGL